MTVVFTMVACGGGGGGTSYVNVTFELGEAPPGTPVPGTPPAAQKIQKGHGIQVPADPTPPSGYEFNKWIKKGTTDTVDNATTFDADTVVVATWMGPSVNITFTAYDGADPEVIRLKSGESFRDAGIALPTDGTDADPNNPTKVFAKWVDEDGLEVTLDSSFWVDTELVGLWYETAFTDAVGAEKVRVNNGALAIYEFDLSSSGIGTGPNGDVTIDDLDKLTGIVLKQKINEQTYKTATLAAFRAFGPYAFNTDTLVNMGTWRTGDVMYGDFTLTDEGHYAALLEGNAGIANNADVLRFNKFHPYMVYNNSPGDFGYNQETRTWANHGQPQVTGPIEIDTWYTVTLDFNGDIAGNYNPAAGGTSSYSYGNTLQRIKDVASVDVLAPSTNYNKVYFAVGVSTRSSTTATFLNKDVTLKITGASDVVGTPPNLDGDASKVDQTFAEYHDGSRLSNWRGAPDATIATWTAGTESVGWDGGPQVSSYYDTPEQSDGTGSFYLRLGNDYETPPAFNNASPVGNSSFTGDFTKGPLVLNFTGQNREIVSIALTPAQRALLADVDTLGTFVVTLDGTSTNSSAEYRFAIGDPNETGTWQSTNLPQNSFENLFDRGLDYKKNATGEALDANGEVTTDPNEYVYLGTTTATRSRASQLYYFMLQNMNSSTDTVTINSIKISYKIEPYIPPAATTDFVFYKSGVIGGPANDGAVVKQLEAATVSNYFTFSDLNAIGPIVFPNVGGTQMEFRSYKHFNIKVKYFKADGTEITITDQLQAGQVNIGGIDHYNLGEDTGANSGGTVNVDLVAKYTTYASLDRTNNITLNFQARNNAAAIQLAGIELLEISFSKD